MCGIVGIAGDLNGVHDKLLKMLLVLDSLRGEDSTGVAFVNKYTGGTSVAKQLGDPFNLFNDGKFTGNMNKLNRVFIGHNRYATSGGVAKSSAHPFDFDTLVGVHNGTIQAKYRLQDHDDFKVDSQALYHNIEILGVKEAIKPLGGPGNAWSLVWWDKKAETLNFLRNKERPMFMTRSDDGKALFWASEYWMLEVALFRANIKHGDIFTTDEDMHYSLHIDNKGVMHKPRVERVAAEPMVYPIQQGNWNHGNNRDGHKPHHINKPVQGNVVHLPPVNQQSSGGISLNKTTTAVTPAASKGVDVPKKIENPSGLASDHSYATAKKRKLEILVSRKDGNGCKYLTMFDPDEPCVDIRLYPRKEDVYLYDMEGADITGDISGFDNTDRTALRGYYKVSPWTVNLVLAPTVEDLTKQAAKDLQSLLEEEEEGMMICDHRGKLIPQKEWELQYSLCSWCDDKLNVLDKNRYTTTGDCLCPSCAKKEEVTQYVSLM